MNHRAASADPERPPLPASRRWATDMGFVFLVALAVRLGAVLALGHWRAPVLHENGAIATNLLQGRGFRKLLYPPRSQTAPPQAGASRKGSRANDSDAGPLTSNQAPGYPFLLYVTWRLAGSSPWSYLLLSVLQALAASSIVFPMRWLTRRWFGEAAEPWTLWLVCWMPVPVWFVTRIHQPALVISLYPWTLAGWLSLQERFASPLRAASVGLATGALALLQPVAAVALGAATATQLACARLRPSGAVVIAALVTGAALLPWTARNLGVHGRLLFVKNCFWKEFWIGNNPKATGTDIYLDAGEVRSVFRDGGRDLLDQNARDDGGEMALMDSLGRAARQHVRAHPGEFLLRTARKIVWFWTTVPARLLDRESHAARLAFSTPLLGLWLALVAAACLALKLQRLPPIEYLAVLGAFLVTYSGVYGLTHVSNARFRAEMEFLLLPCAAEGMRSAWIRIAQAWSGGTARSPSRRS